MIREATFVLAIATAVGACGSPCPDGTYPLPEGGCAPLDGDDAGDDQEGNASGGGGGSNDGGNNDGGGGGNNNGGGGNQQGGRIGDRCQVADDCAGNLFCVLENAAYDDYGICTEGCSSWADCSEAFWECCDIGNGGSACIPDDWVDRNPYAVCD